MSLILFSYAKCGTCKKAEKWLKARHIEVELRPIVEAPPDEALLHKVLRASGLELKRLFNTSGQSYRNGGWKEKLPSISETEALQALAADGKLIKRPILWSEDGPVALVGFSESAFEEALG